MGGNESAGVLQYMEEIAFCEGGHPSNPYRVDPFIAVAVLFGDIREECVQRWGERLSHLRQQEPQEPKAMAEEEHRCVTLLSEGGEDANGEEANTARETLQWIESFRKHKRERERQLLATHSQCLNELSLLVGERDSEPVS